MQRNNLLLFFVAGTAFLVGAYFLDKYLTPIPVPKKETLPEARKPFEGRPLSLAQARGRALGLLAGGPSNLLTRESHARALGLALGGTGLQLAHEAPARSRAVGLAAGGTGRLLAGLAPPPPPREVKPPPPRPVVQKPEPPLIHLGSNTADSPFHLGVELSPRGACVRQIILNKFQAASREGLPEDARLTLIPNDAHIPGANILYHYPIENPKAELPLATLGDQDWRVVATDTQSDAQTVSFQAEVQGVVRITKTFILKQREYHLALEVKLERLPNAPTDLKFRYQLTGPQRLPIEGQWYTGVFRHALIGWVDQSGNMYRSSADIRQVSKELGGEAVVKGDERRLRYAAVGVQYFASGVVVDNKEQPDQDFLESIRPTLETRVVQVELERPYEGEFFLKLRDKKNPKNPATVYHLTPEVQQELIGRAPGKNGTFGLLVIPQPLESLPAGKLEEAPENLFAVKLLSQADTQPLFYDDVTVRVNTVTVDLADKPVVHKYLLYNGPIKPMLLGQMTGEAAVAPALVDRYVDTLQLKTFTDVPGSAITRSCLFSWWSALVIFFTNVMHRVLWYIHLVLPNYGLCVLVMTLIVRGMMFPVSRKQTQTSIKMQALAPELKKLNEKFKDNPQARTEAMMALYRKHGVHPLGSCWLLLLQMPIFMGLYYALQESVHFRLAPFLWIRNLAAPDMLIKWGENIPWISRPEDYGGLLYLGPYFNLLPILAVGLMIMQQQLLMPPPTDEQQAMQQKMMKYMMIFFGFMFYKVAAGLCIYFIASSLWGFAERKLLPKKQVATPEDGTPEELPSEPRERAEERSTAVTTEPQRDESALPNLPGGNRSRKRQERRRRQERFAQGPSSAPSTPPPRPVATGPNGGWLSDVRRRFRDWWDDLLKKASKK
jgi:YidC/Oxa1 family membrane protein insertase